MTGFTQTFGGTVVYASDVSYRAVALSANVTLSWPTELATNTNVVASIMDVTPTTTGLTITMPAANQASVGETALFFNAGSDTFTVADAGGNTIIAVAAGIAWQVYLTGNSTANGTWRATQYGAGTSSASAGSLVGLGIKAINTTLNQAMSVTSLGVDYSVGSSDRAGAFVWTGGAGTLTLPSAATVGNDWFFQVRNGGTGAISIAATGGQLINGSATLTFNPGDSAIIVCDGSAFFTIGFGQSAAFAFDFVSIDLTSQASPYTLSGANLNRIAYQFSGTLTGNMQVIVPSTVQQYWVANETDVASAAYTIEVKTASSTGVILSRSSRAIMYCNGTDVVDADTSTISLPISVAQGGTSATTASGARVNLGGTSTGIAVFTAADAAAGRTALSAAELGANSDITSMTGLTSLTFSDSSVQTKAAVLQVNEFAVSGTWTKPTGATVVMVECYGGGGGGGGGSNGSTGLGGGGGGGGASYSVATFLASSLGATETVTIGAGGTAGVGSTTTAGTAGGNGGVTTFGSFLRTFGGLGGGSSTSTSSGGAAVGTDAFGGSTSGAGGDAPGSAGRAGNGAFPSACGGGSGAGNGQYVGGAGGSSGSATGGGGAAGADSGSGAGGAGTGTQGGGGGGADNTPAVNGVGGAGGPLGGGGGGGAYKANGGAGGSGYCRVTTW